MTYSFHIDEVQFTYLVKQRGNLKHLQDDRAVWKTAYDNCMNEIYTSLLPWLPETVINLMDVGSGLGGIDVLLSQHYNKTLQTITFIDGLDDPPTKTPPLMTFSNSKVSSKFLKQNGVMQTLNYQAPDYVTSEFVDPDRVWKQDLIVSFGSWCFHYSPETYLEYMRRCCHPETILILEVRTENTDWIKQLSQEFVFLGKAHEEEKFQRLVYQFQ